MDHGEIMRILIADDHPFFRAGLRLELGKLASDIEYFEVETFQQCIHEINQGKDFELVLIDLDMPDSDGIEVIRTIRDLLPNACMVVISGTETVEVIAQVLSFGVQGYIPKSSPRPVVIKALELVMSGGIYLPPELLMKIGRSSAGHLQAEVSRDRCLSDTAVSLTQRESEVLLLLAQGMMNKEIARKLNISNPTVRAHVTAIFRSLNVNNRTQAGHVASKLGLI